ncbi:unnamed protein product [Caenorhabditis angaria]|uniref:BTB domain-containing protein n=1 Tax=Caenorhabditis angaria TaxID=860376 RepID=A0A9P1N8S7_9PELO|nr:unnamed protein product [Caenorhabditis angaria]
MFDENIVKQVIDWMYTGTLEIEENQLEQLSKIIAYLRIDELQILLEKYVVDLSSKKRKAIYALNIATITSSFSNEIIENIILKISPTFDSFEKLTFNSIQTIMTSKTSTQKKVGFVNMALRWMKIKHVNLSCRSIIIQSLYISGIEEQSLDLARQILYRNLNKIFRFDKTTQEISIEDINPIRGVKPIKLQNERKRKTFSQISVLNEIEDPFSNDQTPILNRTTSEIQNIQEIQDPFVKFSKLSESQISMLEKVEDPFSSNQTPIFHKADSEVQNLNNSVGTPACFSLDQNNNCIGSSKNPRSNSKSRQADRSNYLY